MSDYRKLKFEFTAEQSKLAWFLLNNASNDYKTLVHPDMQLSKAMNQLSDDFLRQLQDQIPDAQFPNYK